MGKKMILGLSILIVLVVSATVWFVMRNNAEIEELESDLADLVSPNEHSVGESSERVSNTTATYQPPPLGETDDTGYWKGSTWHQKPAPKPNKRRFWSEDPDKLAYQMMHGRYTESKQLARRIIRDYPYSDAALEARYHIMSVLGVGTEEEGSCLKGMLKYHPNSTRVLTDLATNLDIVSPEEAIAFGQKSLRIDPSDELAHLALGRAYQRLGDYKTALVHLKSGQKLSDPEEYSYIEFTINGKDVSNGFNMIAYEISMIEAGTPRFGPDPEPADAFVMDVGMSVPPSSVPPPSPDLDSVYDPSDLPELPPVDERVVDSAVPSLRDAASARGRQAVESERLASVREQQRKEFESFLRWMDTIEQAKSPADLEDFLMREMATHLRGGSSEFTPDRLIRAFETMDRHGETAGLRALEKLDAELARELLRERPKKRMPPIPPKRK